MNFKTVFIDEAHNFRNHKSKRYILLQNIISKINPYKTIPIWTLTGTPIVNKSNDLNSLKKITHNESKSSDEYYKENIFFLKNNAETYIVNTNNIYINMDDQQLNKYIKIKNELQFDCFLEKIMRLRQVCTHTDISIPNDILENTNISDVPSNKIHKIIDIVNNTEKDDKIIICIEWTRLALIIQKCLKLKGYNSIIYANQQSVDLFNESNDFKILIINIKSAVGLNLQVANHCIFVSPYWNDAIIQQAIGRIKRIGQTKQIFIYNLYSHNSIEMWINNIIKNKIKLTKLDQTIKTKDINDDNQYVLHTMLYGFYKQKKHEEQENDDQQQNEDNKTVEQIVMPYYTDKYLVVNNDRTEVICEMA
jgi:SNF2 family DNA or RNA helicase